LLKQQGAVKQRSAADVEREAQQKRNDVWLADKRARDAKLQMDRIKARSGNSADMDQAAREYANKMREQQDAKAALAAYKDYNPDVQMNYFDEFGRGTFRLPMSCQC
jgi:U4/U6.U5 tri-snRNP-associated protein 1